MSPALAADQAGYDEVPSLAREAAVGVLAVRSAGPADAAGGGGEPEQDVLHTQRTQLRVLDRGEGVERAVLRIGEDVGDVVHGERRRYGGARAAMP